MKELLLKKFTVNFTGRWLSVLIVFLSCFIVPLALWNGPVAALFLMFVVALLAWDAKLDMDEEKANTDG